MLTFKSGSCISCAALARRHARSADVQAFICREVELGADAVCLQEVTADVQSNVTALATLQLRAWLQQWWVGGARLPLHLLLGCLHVFIATILHRVQSPVQK